MGSGAAPGGLAFFLMAIVVAVFIAPRLFDARKGAVSTIEEPKAPRRLINLGKLRPRKKGNDSKVSEAFTALHREKIMSIESKREKAKLQAELSRAKAEHAKARIEARREALLQAKAERQLRLQSPAMRNVRLAFAWLTFLGLLCVFAGFGFVMAGQGWLVAGIGAGFVAVMFAGLLIMAPGRGRQVAAPVSQRVSVHTAEPVFDVTETAPVELAVVDNSAERYRLAQQAAAERIRRAQVRARARQSHPAVKLVRQEDSILLAEATEQQPESELQTLDVKPVQTIEETGFAGLIGDSADGAVNLTEAFGRWRKAS